MSTATATASSGAAGNGGLSATDPESQYGHDGVSYRWLRARREKLYCTYVKLAQYRSTTIGSLALGVLP